MKKLTVSLLSLSLITSCSSTNTNNMNIIEESFSFTSYKEEVIVIKTYEEFTSKVSNYKEIKGIDEDYFIDYNLVSIFITSNAEEANNGIEFIKMEEINNNYYFTFETYIKDEATDLAFFINDINFKISKEYNLSKENITVNVIRKIRKNN